MSCQSVDDLLFNTDFIDILHKGGSIFNLCPYNTITFVLLPHPVTIGFVPEIGQKVNTTKEKKIGFNKQKLI
jgi:hypothetical protein